MKKLVLLQLLLFILFFLSSHLPSYGQGAGKQVPVKIPATNSTTNALLYLPWDYNVSGKKYPLILFGHGISETTISSLAHQGLPGIISNNNPPYAIVNGDTVHFIVLSITGQAFLSEKTMSDGAKDLIQRGIRIDPKRIYITGLSAGARSSVGYISHQQQYNYQPVAASVPMSYTLTVKEMNSGIWVKDFNAFAGKGLWAFTGKTDTHTDVAEALVDSVNAHSPGNGRLTIYPGGHCCWTTYYDPKYRENVNGKTMNIYEWMYQYSINSIGGKPSAPLPNIPPKANAGGYQTITLPKNTIKLNGTASYDPDGNISSYKWTQYAGPANATFDNSTSATPTASNLVAGEYTFDLRVTDNRGGSSTGRTQVTVKNLINHPPKANAGANQTIILPTNSARLSAVASSDPDGQIVSYKWVQYAGPTEAAISNSTSITATVSNLVTGVYTFNVTITDNNGSSTSGQTNVTVKKSINQLPKANAGGYQTITLPKNAVKLNGSGSYDPDGRIASYKWTQYAGPAKAAFNSTTSMTPIVSDLVVGVYVFDLTTTDNNGNSTTGRTQVTVKNYSNNKPPKANAGGYQTITPPKGAVKLNGSGSYDPDGRISSYKWAQYAGPTKATFNSKTSVTPTVSNLVVGVYVFDLTATDNNGSTATGRTQVTVFQSTPQLELRTINTPYRLTTIKNLHTDQDSLPIKNKSAFAFSTFNSHNINSAKFSSLSIYPNPVQDLLHITFYKATAGKIALRIVNMYGQIMKTSNYNELSGKVSKTLHLDRLEPGIYLIQLFENDELTVSKKMIKL